ncbi:MAG: helix-turn-helix domain-containing protein [Bacillota bacterium]
MGLSYNKLWKLLIDKGMKKMELRDRLGISNSTLAKLGKNELVSLAILEKICVTLNCNIGDIVDYVPNKQKDGDIT